MGDTCSINQARTPGGTASCLARSPAYSESDSCTFMPRVQRRKRYSSSTEEHSSRFEVWVYQRSKTLKFLSWQNFVLTTVNINRYMREGRTVVNVIYYLALLQFATRLVDYVQYLLVQRKHAVF